MKHKLLNKKDLVSGKVFITVLRKIDDYNENDDKRNIPDPMNIKELLESVKDRVIRDDSYSVLQSLEEIDEKEKYYFDICSNIGLQMNIIDKDKKNLVSGDLVKIRRLESYKGKEIIDEKYPFSIVVSTEEYPTGFLLNTSISDVKQYYGNYIIESIGNIKDLIVQYKNEVESVSNRIKNGSKRNIKLFNVTFKSDKENKNFLMNNSDTIVCFIVG